MASIEKSFPDNYYVPEMNSLPYIENGQIGAGTSTTTVNTTSSNNENMDGLPQISTSYPMYNDNYSGYYYYVKT